MSNLPTDLKYTRSHEWVRQLASGELEIGITDHAQAALGDLVFVEVPSVGRQVEAGAACAVVESVKAASDIYSPVTGTVVAMNVELATQPELVNQQPYGAGWLFRISHETRGTDATPAGATLLTAAEYEHFLTTEAE
jgi:glycine cleavage system H protein